LGEVLDGVLVQADLPDEPLVKAVLSYSCWCCDVIFRTYEVDVLNSAYHDLAEEP
jgi:hypothetical protein